MSLSLSSCSLHPRGLPSFPTRRSSDLPAPDPGSFPARASCNPPGHQRHDSHEHGSLEEATVSLRTPGEQPARHGQQDRKSTRLNSSHANISYAVFCLKKKNNYNLPTPCPLSYHVTLSLLMFPPPPRSTLFPYTTLFRSPCTRPRIIPCQSVMQPARPPAPRFPRAWLP